VERDGKGAKRHACSMGGNTIGFAEIKSYGLGGGGAQDKEGKTENDVGSFARGKKVPPLDWRGKRGWKVIIPPNGKLGLQGRKL